MAKPVILCADSTCDLSPELIERFGVHVLPLHITLDGKSYDDGVEIFPDDVFENYRKNKTLPSTAAINVGEYEDFLRGFTDAGNEVVYISLGASLSSTYRNCCLAAEEIPGVYVVDSGNLSTGMGLVVIEAAERIAAGMEAKQVAEEVRAFTGKVETSFVLDTLEFLHKGGRCSALAMLGANMLKLRPCIEVNNADGSMSVGKKYRGVSQKVWDEYIADRLKDRTDIRTDRVFITHSGMDQESVDRLVSTIAQYQDFGEIMITRAGCTVSSHCGPNCMGVLFARK